ncbi:hypothetical protein [Microcoleus sp. herbarium14]
MLPPLGYFSELGRRFDRSEPTALLRALNILASGDRFIGMFCQFYL